jgi:hypothetical protein
MKFAAYLPKNETNEKLPVIIWLSGLTCTEQNFITKSGFQQYASEHRIIVVATDTSPSKFNDSYRFFKDLVLNHLFEKGVVTLRTKQRDGILASAPVST